MLEGLGEELLAARRSRGLTLGGVAGPARISVAYLQKLENGGVRDPSPRVLRRLAGALGVPYRRLMELAGYWEDAEGEVPAVPRALAGEDLTDEEWRAVGAFVRYLKDAR